MKTLEAYQKLKSLKLQIFETKDAAVCLGISSKYASDVLNRIASSESLIQLKRGVWAFPENINHLMVPMYLTSPSPSYISLLTALYYHGMIEQIPDITYAITLGKRKIWRTPVGDFSIHHLQAELFFGYEFYKNTDVLMATPEKALMDVIILSLSKLKFFAKLPELVLPENFSTDTCMDILERIPNERRKKRAIQYFENLLDSLGS